jgi:hypothetical protein
MENGTQGATLRSRPSGCYPQTCKNKLYPPESNFVYSAPSPDPWSSKCCSVSDLTPQLQWTSPRRPSSSGRPGASETEATSSTSDRAALDAFWCRQPQSGRYASPKNNIISKLLVLAPRSGSSFWLLSLAPLSCSSFWLLVLAGTTTSCERPSTFPNDHHQHLM